LSCFHPGSSLRPQIRRGFFFGGADTERTFRFFQNSHIPLLPSCFPLAKHTTAEAVFSSILASTFLFSDSERSGVNLVPPYFCMSLTEDASLRIFIRLQGTFLVPDYGFAEGYYLTSTMAFPPENFFAPGLEVFPFRFLPVFGKLFLFALLLSRDIGTLVAGLSCFLHQGKNGRTAPPFPSDPPLHRRGGSSTLPSLHERR